MAKKTSTKTLEHTYTIPLRKEFSKVPKYKRTNKAVKAVKEFLQKHMKSEEVKLGKHLNEELWKHGIKNPPHHVKVITKKDKDGVVKAELFGHQIEEKKEEKKKSKLQELAKKAGVKMPKETPKKEEKKPQSQLETAGNKISEAPETKSPSVKEAPQTETKKPSQESTQSQN